MRDGESGIHAIQVYRVCEAEREMVREGAEKRRPRPERDPCVSIERERYCVLREGRESAETGESEKDSEGEQRNHSS